jgi:Protein of unknown function (DUF2946)
MTPARRRFGWLAAVSLLLQGWLPILLQVAMVAGHGNDWDPQDTPICSAAAAVAAASPRPTRGPECPVTHDRICLCAIFANLLTPELGPAPTPPLVVRRARRRPPAQRPVRSRPVAPFEARAPPVFG